MRWFYNLKVAAKLIIGFITVALIAGIVGMVGITNIKNIDSKYSDLFTQYGEPLTYLGDAMSNFQRTRGNLRDLILDKGKDRTQYLNNIKKYDQVIDNSLTQFEKDINTDDTRSKFNDMKSNLSKFRTIENQIIETAMAGHEDEALVLFRGEAQTLASSIDDSLNKLQDTKVTNGNKISSELTARTNRTVIIMIVIVAIAMIAAVGLGIFISRIIGNPVRKLVGIAEKIADGDLNVSVDVETKDEIGSLQEAFKKMVNNTNDVMQNINNAAEQVSSGSKQVSGSSIALSQGATEQASSIEELTASLEEISSQTRLNAQNANEANKLSESAKSNAVQGNSQMQEMLTAMEDINDASGNISKIIKVIDDIAFQTNILALNAAVEAARAGQHGKGFAVVAEEVRNLAARSANAAKETTDLIENSIKKVDGGTKIARETAGALTEIVNGVEKVATLVNDIAVASNEQALGIEQINQGIMQVSQVIQANSATSEESAAASEELSSQASLLKEMVGKFKLKQNGISYNNLDELNPDVLRMLEKMAEKKNNKLIYTNTANEEAAVTKSKIALSDKEFGKY